MADSPTLEILGALNVHNSMTAIEARLDSFEIDLARMAGSRDDDARRIAGELAVMKARVEDALAAFAATAVEIRDQLKAASTTAPNLAVLREQIEAQIEGATAGIGDVLTSMAADIRARADQVVERLAAMDEGLSATRESVSSVESLLERVAALEARA